MCDLYYQWSDEEGWRFDEEFFIRHMIEGLKQGCLVPLVACDEETSEPVGCCLMTVYRDVLTGRLTAMPDHLYVVPEARGSKVGIQLALAANAFADLLEVEARRVPARPETANYYWKHLPPGYRLDTVIFTKET